MAGRTPVTAEERYYLASQWQLMARKFRRHKLAIVGSVLVAVLAVLALFCEFFSTNDPGQEHVEFINAPPQRLRFVDQGRPQITPFVYGLKRTIDETTFRRIYVPDTGRRLEVRFLAPGYPYRLLGLLPTDIHLMGRSTARSFSLAPTASAGTSTPACCTPRASRSRSA